MVIFDRMSEIQRIMSLKDLVLTRLTETGRNPHEAARIGVLERTFVRDLLNGKKKSVRGDSIRKLALALDVSEDTVMQAMNADDSRDLNSPTDEEAIPREAFLWFAEAIALDRGHDIEAARTFAKVALESVLRPPRPHVTAPPREQAHLRVLDVLEQFPSPKPRK